MRVIERNEWVPPTKRSRCQKCTSLVELKRSDFTASPDPRDALGSKPVGYWTCPVCERENWEQMP